MTAMLFRPTFPVSRAPARMGTLSPLSVSPIRRLKKRSAIRPVELVDPTAKCPAFSRKNSLFSGKKRGNRVRFTCSSSTSAWAKSVLKVTSRFRLAVTAYFTSSPTSASVELSVIPPSSRLCPPPVTYGLIRRSLPLSRDSRLVSLPARLTLVRANARGIGAQNTCSFLRRMCSA